MKKAVCSPKRGGKESYTCLTYGEMQKIARDYNKALGKGKEKIDVKLPKRELWEALQKVDRNKSGCNGNEYCWIKKNYGRINKDYKKFLANYRPEKPVEWREKPNKWLNTYDILYTMKQYEDANNDFKFLGVYPIDFMKKYDGSSTCVSPLMCALNANSIKKAGKTKLGVVYNLDKHYQSGSHWTGLYIDLGKGEAYYYDSVGTRPPQEIFEFINRLNGQLSKNKLKFAYNKNQHQRENTECGVFSMYFIENMIESDGKFNEFIERSDINDDKMKRLRNYFYNNIETEVETKEETKERLVKSKSVKNK